MGETMEGLLRELPMHHGLARLFNQLGEPGFWRTLALLLRQLAPVDNALAVRFQSGQPPQVLEECGFGPGGGASPMPFYCQGLYLLDPFYQLTSGFFDNGLYHLPDIAPDQFHQGEYYLSYLSSEVGQDETQYLLRLGSDSVLSLSLGCAGFYPPEAIGRLRVVQGWVLAAMQRHWALADTAALPAAQSTLSDQLGSMLQQFGKGRLTEREAEIARLTLRGLSSKAVAHQLAISPETVKTHRRNMFLKLGVANHTELFNCFMSQLQALERQS